MHSLSEQYLKRLSFSADQAATLAKLGESRGRQDLFTQQAPEILESLRQVAAIESSESSNRLEGIVAPRERVQAIVLKETAPRTRSEQEIAGYRDVLNLVHESHQHIPFSSNVLLQLHAMLLRYLPSGGGKWKSTDNEIVERNRDGSIHRVRFKCVPAAATPSAINQLVDNYKTALDADQEPLVIVPLAIFDMLCIHPFIDGNGRISRLLTLLLLYHHGIQVGRYISLERIFEESKETYYEALENSSTHWHQGKHDPHPWLNYFWGALLRATSEFEQRVGTIRPSRGSKTDQIQQAVFRRINPFSISDIEADCPSISRDMIRIVLRQLRDAGTIVPQGKGRGAKWLRKQT